MDAESSAQSAAAPSPFPPIADYAFLFDCHTGALVAPDGAIDRFCIPRFDAQRVREPARPAGGVLRLGPFGISHPAARAHEPGTNGLVTSWKTPTGWVVVRDSLTMGPREREDTITPHTPPPTRWSLVGDDRHAADATAGDGAIRLRTDLALGVTGNRIRGRHTLAARSSARRSRRRA